jgi:hypothetical protein
MKIRSPVSNGKPTRREKDTEIDIETEGQMNNQSLLSLWSYLLKCGLAPFPSIYGLTYFLFIYGIITFIAANCNLGN